MTESAITPLATVSVTGVDVDPRADSVMVEKTDVALVGRIVRWSFRDHVYPTNSGETAVLIEKRINSMEETLNGVLFTVEYVLTCRVLCAGLVLDHRYLSAMKEIVANRVHAWPPHGCYTDIVKDSFFISGVSFDSIVGAAIGHSPQVRMYGCNDLLQDDEESTGAPVVTQTAYDALINTELAPMRKSPSLR